MNVIERFLGYARIDTTSVQPTPGVTQVHPSSSNQRVLVDKLQFELNEMGVPDSCFVRLDDGSLLVRFEPTPGRENAPHVVFTAHVDTYFGCPGGAKPLVHNYGGGDIVLPNDGVIIPASDLAGLAGKRIITADGTTLLGGDDKAGVAAIMCFVEEMMKGEMAHGSLTIWFCVDEEIGEVGVKFLPEGTAQQWSIFWTVDANGLDVIDTGCFFGAKVELEFRGNDTHPGVSGQALKPAHYAAGRFIDNLAGEPCPWNTKDEQSFFYVPALPAGSASKANLTVYPRTFRQEDFPEMHAIIKRIAEEAAAEFGCTVVVSEMKVMYVSTEVAIDANRHLLHPAQVALEGFGFTPKLHRVRAGTDGAMLNMTYPDIPAPNLGTGGRNLHGVREFVVADELEILPQVLVKMVQRYATMTR